MKINVLLTGVGGGGHGEQILKALRMGHCQYFIVGTDVEEYSSGFESVDVAYTVPRANHLNYLDLILELCKRHNVQVLFHGSENEMMLFAKHRARIEAAGIYLPINADGVLRICQDKMKTMSFLREKGFNVPESRIIDDITQLRENEKFPVVLKPVVGGGGSANVYIAQDIFELENFVGHLLRYHQAILLQEYIGRPDSEFTVGVLFGADGVLINSIAIRRIIHNALSVRLRVPNRSGRHDLGASLVISSGVSQGQVGRWPEVTEQCEKIAQALMPNAPVNIQCRVVDGVVFPFEINPRFSGTTSLRAMVGYNEPDLLIRRDVLGEKIKTHFAYDECTIMRGLQEIKLTRSVISSF
jgi:carbamoyl-phosphate synthase large subunit